MPFPPGPFPPYVPNTPNTNIGAVPWLTSDQLASSVQLNIMFPIAQNTFTIENILQLANKELSTSQIPSVLQFHEEFFVHKLEVPLVNNQSIYPIPKRAIGLKLRDLYYRDSSHNLTEMTRVTGNDDFFVYGSGSGTPPYKFKLEDDAVHLIPYVGDISSVGGTLVFYYYLRPNQLVRDARAAIITNFLQSITINNAAIAPGDTVSINVTCESTDPNPFWYPNAAFLRAQVLSTITFTAVSGAPSALQFQIGATSIATASNLVAAINLNGTYISANSNSTSSSVDVEFDSLFQTITTSNVLGFVIPTTMGIQFNQLPSTYTDQTTNITTPLYIPGAYIDFLQTEGGHKIYSYDVQIPVNGITTISFSPTPNTQTNTILFPIQNIPSALIVGDYICLANECIIPGIPSDLHEVLAERVSARIQRALGDQAGLQATMGKVQEMEVAQAKLIDNRTEGTPQKVLGRHTMLNIMARRRSHLRGW
jgi:hypothetical protein